MNFIEYVLLGIILGLIFAGIMTNIEDSHNTGYKDTCNIRYRIGKSQSYGSCHAGKWHIGIKE